MSDETNAVAVDPNSHQVGGDHYVAPIQHWDFVESNGLGYLEGCATKYVSRWRKKEGLKDLQKAVHYVEKIKDLFAKKKKFPRTLYPEGISVRDFALANSLTCREYFAVAHIAGWKTERELDFALEDIQFLMSNG